MKNLPIGIDDYLSIIDSFYVDKTLFIKELIDYANGKSFLITRPRRFGKSLTLSMVEYFFTNRNDYSYAFKNKNIFKAGDKYISCLNSYPVIRLNMKDISADSYESLMLQTKRMISELYRLFPELENSDKLFKIEKDNYINISNEVYDDIFKYSSAIKDLSLYLYKHYNKKVIILIDEYDTPIQISYENGFYDQSIQFYKVLYSSALKGNQNLYFSLVTGVLEVSKESLFSGLNNLLVFSILDRDLSQYFGFTKEEVLQIIDDYKLNVKIDELEKWYGGYGVDASIFNPWSIINYINSEKVDNYWSNTGTNSLINSLIDKFNMDEISFAEYLNNKNMSFNYDKSISYKDLNNVNSLFSFLVQSGYLTAENKDNNLYSLKIPNIEISNIFKKEIILRNNELKNPSLAINLRNAIISRNTDSISNCFEKYILDSFSYYDLIQEKDYKVLVVGILSILFEDYVVKSEVNSKNGRCDIMISPKNKNDIGIIIELKKYKGQLSHAILDKYANKAIEQIKEIRYYQELVRRECNEILMYGFVFDDSKVKIKESSIKNI